ncbi:hypothetical protein [Stygiolobus azoricus]|nr:hypothetical protein [Stygiolobus azoricus]
MRTQEVVYIIVPPVEATMKLNKKVTTMSAAIPPIRPFIYQ